jgi:hypothetical protein
LPHGDSAIGPDPDKEWNIGTDANGPYLLHRRVHDRDKPRRSERATAMPGIAFDTLNTAVHRSRLGVDTSYVTLLGRAKFC